MDKKKMLEALAAWPEACDKVKSYVQTNVNSNTDDYWIRRQGEEALAASDSLRGVATRIMGVDCPRCGGVGSYMYGSTSTWRGGMGGASMTSGVCDMCWGTGRTDKKGVDLRRMEAEMRRLEKEASLRWFESRLGYNLEKCRENFSTIAGKLKRARWGEDFWLQRTVEILVGILEDLSEEKE